MMLDKVNRPVKLERWMTSSRPKSDRPIEDNNNTYQNMGCKT